MTQRTLSSLQRLFVTGDRRLALAVTVALCLAAGLVAGAYMAAISPLYAIAGLLALAAGLLMLRDTQWGLLATVALICLLPFGALPFKIGFTPTFLDLAFIATYLVWIVRIATGKSGKLIGTQLGLPIIVFLLLACASFVAGLAHAYLSQYVLRHFVEILLSIGLFFVVVNCIQTAEQLRVLVLAIIVLGCAAALVGVVLYFLPSTWSIRLLSALGRFGYPTGSGVLRYIEDNPDLAQRAISTSTDPNVLGGLLILITTLTAAQLFARRPILSRTLLGGMVLVDLLCLYLTYSRGSMLGLAVGLAVLAVAKYRRLVPAMVAAALLLLLLPQTQAYVQRFIEGIQIQDLATQMRLGEYKDALILIGRHPWIGVGFVGTPEGSLYIGVSNVYLLMAEEMGLIGLSVFLLIIGLFYDQARRAWPHMPEEYPSTAAGLGQRASAVIDLSAMLLGLSASIAGILVGGLLDHYFFNLSFPHSVSIFWLYLGLTMVVIRFGTTGTNSPRPALGRAAERGQPAGACPPPS